MQIQINSQEAEWLRQELEIMIDEKIPRSQFSVNTMRSLLAKLNERHEKHL